MTLKIFYREKVEFEREINLTENQQNAEQMKLYLVYTLVCFLQTTVRANPKNSLNYFLFNSVIF